MTKAGRDEGYGAVQAADISSTSSDKATPAAEQQQRLGVDRRVKPGARLVGNQQ